MLCPHCQLTIQDAALPGDPCAYCPRCGGQLPAPPPAPPLPPQPPAQTAIAIQRRDIERHQVRRSTPATSTKSAVKLIGTVIGGFVGLAMGVMIVFYLTGQDLLGLSGKMRSEPEPLPVVIAPSAPTPASKYKPASGEQKLQSRRTQVKSSQSPIFPLPPVVPPVAVEPPPLTPPVVPTPIAPPSPPPGPLVARLPVLLSPEPAPLLPLSADPVDPLDIAIHSGAADIPAKSTIVAEKESSEHEWTVTHLSDVESPGKREPLGFIRLGQRELLFAWKTPLADVPARRQFANCLLEIRHGSEPRIAQLREVAKTDPLVLDFQRSSQTLQIGVNDLPAYGKVVLKIRELSDFARGGKIRGDGRMLALGKTAFIDFSEMPGAEIELKFVLAPAGGGLILRSEPVFKEKSRKNFDLTYAALEKERAEVDRLYSSMQAELASLKILYEKAKADLRSIPPSATGPQIVAKTRLATQLGQQVAAAEGIMAAPKARLDAAISVKAFMDFLHERATIRFAVCAISGDKEIVLAESSR